MRAVFPELAKPVRRGERWRLDPGRVSLQGMKGTNFEDLTLYDGVAVMRSEGEKIDVGDALTSLGKKLKRIRPLERALRRKFEADLEKLNGDRQAADSLRVAFIVARGELYGEDELKGEDDVKNGAT